MCRIFCLTVLRHIAIGRRIIRDEDADVDTAAAVDVGDVRNSDGNSLLKVSRGRRTARPLPASFRSADTGMAALYFPSEHIARFSPTVCVDRKFKRPVSPAGNRQLIPTVALPAVNYKLFAGI